MECQREEPSLERLREGFMEERVGMVGRLVSENQFGSGSIDSVVVTLWLEEAVVAVPDRIEDGYPSMGSSEDRNRAHR